MYKNNLNKSKSSCQQFTSLTKFVFTDFFFLLLLIIIVSIPLLVNNIVGQIDSNAHLYRMTSFIEAINCHQFPPKWAHRAGLGIGTPVFMYNWSLPYFIVWFFTKFGFTILVSVKLFYFLTNILAGTGFYLFINKLFSKKLALFGSILYLFMPYRLIISYHYGSWGEMMFLSLIPWAFYFILLIFKNKRKMIPFVGFTVILFLLLISHIPLLAAFIPFIAIFCIWQAVLKKTLIPLLYISGSLFFAFLISSFQLIYLLFERNQIRYFEKIDLFYLPFTKFYDLTNSFLRYAIPLKERPDFWGFTYGLSGILAFFLGLIWIISIILSHKKIGYTNGFFILIWFLVITYLFVALPISTPIWNSITYLFFILYPYRFIAVSGFLSIIFLVYLASIFYKKWILFLVAFLVCLTSFSYLTSSVPDNTSFNEKDLNLPQSPLTDYILLSNMGVNEFLPKNVSGNLTSRIYNIKQNLPLYEILTGDIKVKIINQCGSNLTLETIGSNSSLKLNRLNFPNWKIRINNKIISHSQNSDGFIIFEIPKGNNQIAVTFEDTKIGKYGKLISIVGLLLFLGFLVILK